MKRILYLSILNLLLLQTKCMEPYVVFEEPQPKELKSRTAFNKHYQGKYFCESDSAIVHITDNLLYKEIYIPFFLLEEEVEEMGFERIHSNRILYKESNLTLPATISNDTIWSEVTLFDTLFTISPTQILKYYKGHQVMNTQLEEDKWEVWLLSKEDTDYLQFSKVVLPSDLKELEAITPVLDISTDDQEQYIIKPTVREFKQILESEILFNDCDVFTRLGAM